MEKYIPIEQIGKGSFEVVRKVKLKQDGETLVWKEINFEKMSSREKQQLVTEVNLLKELKHLNIYRYANQMVDKAACKVYIIMEYCARGEKTDIWSTGFLIYQLAVLRGPFEASNHLTLPKKIEEGKLGRILLRYSQNLFALIKQILMINNYRHISVKELLQNPMFVIRANQNILKEKIMAIKLRQQRLKEKERQLQSMLRELKSVDLPDEEQITLYRKKSSKFWDMEKESGNWQNFQSR